MVIRLSIHIVTKRIRLNNQVILKIYLQFRRFHCPYYHQYKMNVFAIEKKVNLAEILR